MRMTRITVYLVIVITMMTMYISACDAPRQQATSTQKTSTFEAETNTYNKVEVSGDFPITYYFKDNTLKKSILWIYGENRQEDQVLEFYFNDGEKRFLVQTVKLYKLHKFKFGPEVDAQWTNRYVLGAKGVISFSTMAPPKTETRKLTWKEIADDLNFIDENILIARQNINRDRKGGRTR